MKQLIILIAVAITGLSSAVAAYDMSTPNPSSAIITPKYADGNPCNSTAWVNLGWTPCMVMNSGSTVYLTGSTGYQQRVLQYSSGALVYAERTHYIRSTHIKREYITQYTHKVELIASCKSGLEYYNQMRYIKPISKRFYSAWVMPVGYKVGNASVNALLPKPYKVQCQFIKSNDWI